MSARILIGDMRERLKELPDNSVDSCVCDPPYHLTSIVKRFGAANAAPAKVGKTGAYERASRGFMGQQWDGGDVAFQTDTWAEVLRVLKPGGHLLAFSGTRTVHRMVCAIEDAGFEIRDSIAWIYGSGFPKSHDVSKGIDRMAGAEREVVGIRRFADGTSARRTAGASGVPGSGVAGQSNETVPATDAAREWQGWGSALKPALEPVCLARKPLSEKSIAANVLKWGTGAINVDGCRVDFASDADRWKPEHHRQGSKPQPMDWGKDAKRFEGTAPQGRWPANLVTDGSDEVLAGFPAARSSCNANESKSAEGRDTAIFGNAKSHAIPGVNTFSDSGSAARFFYTAKADQAERHAGCGDKGNNHPTVKPVSLMQWLVRLVTPPGGTVLDCFMGSGSTGIACQREQFSFIGCELSPEYAAIAEARMRDDAGMFAEVEAA